MSISAVSTLSPTTDTRTAQSNKSSLPAFVEYFDRSLASTEEQNVVAKQSDKTVSASAVTIKIDKDDERAATAELLKLYKMLVSGKIEYSALDNNDTNPGVADGPERTTLETLKTVLRRLIGIQGAINNDNKEDISIRELIKKLPAGIRDLLKKFFPNLEELLLKDENNLAASHNINGVNPKDIPMS